MSHLSTSRLPTRITPCSIINTVVEVRFQTEQSPTVVPGLIYSAVRERFPKQAELPQAQLPDAERNLIPELRYSPTVVMTGDELVLNVGPRVLFLSMIPDREYPGWTAYREMLTWILNQLKPIGVINVPERLGLRYTDFFAQPLNDCLQVQLAIAGRSEIDQHLQIATTVQRDRLQCRIQITHPAILDGRQGAKPGSLLDVDMGFSVPAQNFWEAAVPAFNYAHQVQKRLFFTELLKPTFLATLKPEY
jgi:uncharacterized protein (TIGR04255 family)